MKMIDTKAMISYIAVFQTIVICLIFTVHGCDTRKCYTQKETGSIGTVNEGAMRILTVNNENDLPILRKKASELSICQIMSPETGILYSRMLATVTAPENDGVGIAAPQVGLSYRAIIVQRFDKEHKPFGFYINPAITWYSEQKARGREGCLSIPGYWGTVERSIEITIRYTDINNETHNEKIAGFTAVIFQHEIDHLNGILYTDLTEDVFPDHEPISERD